MIKYIQSAAPDSASKSASKNVNHLRGGGSGNFCDFFGIFIIGGIIAAIVGFILIFVGAASGPSFNILNAGIVLIGIGAAFGVFGIVGCCFQY